MPRRLALLISLLACALGAAAAPSVAAAKMGSCRPDGTGPKCHVWMARVTAINDGDTLYVDLDGDGTHKIYAIRFVGIQAMELTRHNDHNPSKRRGQCHGIEATNLVEKLVRQGHKRVRLTAQDPRTDHLGRLFRSLNVKINGHWVDIGETEMAKGLTLWMHVGNETAWNTIYNRLGQEAAQKHIGMFDTTHCGSGPAQDVPLKVWVMSDPVGPDPREINGGEWVKVRNLSSTKTLSLAKWWIRDSGLRRYTFPAGASVGPGETVTLYVGRGSNTAKSFYWAYPDTVFENSIDGGGVGDGAYLFDPKGDLRAWMIYPCLVACSDPNQGALSVRAHPGGRESVQVRNVSSHAVDLYGYELRISGGYAFPQGTVLQPGEAVTVYVAGSPQSDTGNALHIGISAPYMPDGGGVARVTTFDEISLACDAWGSGHC